MERTAHYGPALMYAGWVRRSPYTEINSHPENGRLGGFVRIWGTTYNNVLVFILFTGVYLKH